MNIAFFLTRKSEVIWLPLEASVQDALVVMQHSGYTAVPLLDEHGGYAGTLSEGDLLRQLTAAPQKPPAHLLKRTLREVPRRVTLHPVGIDAEMEQLLSRAVEQNFVPVVDSRNAFVGIVTRRVVIGYFAQRHR